MGFDRRSLDELSEDYVAKRAKGLQHLLLRYASLNPEMNLEAPQAEEYDLDGLDQRAEQINTLCERIDYEPEMNFEATIDEYPENVQQITRTFTSFGQFDSLTLRDTLQYLYEDISNEAAKLLALEKAGYLSDPSSGKEYSTRREVERAFEWIEDLHNNHYLDPKSNRLSSNSRDLEDIIPEGNVSRNQDHWELWGSVAESSRRKVDKYIEGVDGVAETGDDRLVLLSGELPRESSGSEMKGEIRLERRNGSDIEIDGQATVDGYPKIESDKEIIDERWSQVLASPSWNLARFLNGNR